MEERGGQQAMPFALTEDEGLRESPERDQGAHAGCPEAGGRSGREDELGHEDREQDREQGERQERLSSPQWKRRWRPRFRQSGAVLRRAGEEALQHAQPGRCASSGVTDWRTSTTSTTAGIFVRFTDPE